MSSAAASLAEQARAIEHPHPVPGVSGLWGLEVGGSSFQATQAELEQIRARFGTELRRGLNHVDARIAGGTEGHRDMIRIHEDQFVVSRISDTLGGVSLPDLSIWDGPNQSLWRGRSDLRDARLTAAATDLEEADASSARAYAQFTAYREGTISGASRAQTGLELTRDVSFATAGIIATVATGGAAGAVIGAGITATGTAAQQAMEVHLDMRREIDWAGISFDAVIGLVTSKLGGALGESVAGRIMTNPAAASLGRRAVARIVGDLVSGRAGSILHMTARNLFDNARGSSEAMSMEQFVHALAHSLTDPRSAFMDILNGELGRRVHAATSRPSSGAEPAATPPEQTSRQQEPAVESQRPPAAGGEAAPAAAATEVAPRSESEAAPAAAPVSELAPAPAQAEPAAAPVSEPAPAPAHAEPAAAAPAASPSGLELDTTPRSFEPGVEGPQAHPGESGLELDRSDRSGGYGQDVESMGRTVDLGPAGASIPLDRSRRAPRRAQRSGFGEASQERGGTEARSGMNFHEYNAAEIERGMRIDYDPIAGRPRRVTYRVDSDVAGAPGSDPRSYTQDTSTSGAQSRDAAYTGSGMERGHLAQLEAFKNGSSGAQEAANQFTNLVPMTPELNRGFRDASGEWHDSAWRQSEHRTVNEYAPRYGSVVVEIEPVYGANPRRLPDGTPIPVAVRRRVVAPDGTVLEDQSHLNQ